MEKSEKNLIIQIFWIVVIGIIVWFVYDGQNTKREAKERQDAQRQAVENIKKLCMERAIAKANQFGEGQEKLAEANNPYLVGLKEQIPQLKEDMKIKEYAECMDIWIIEEK